MPTCPSFKLEEDAVYLASDAQRFEVTKSIDNHSQSPTPQGIEGVDDLSSKEPAYPADYLRGKRLKAHGAHGWIGSVYACSVKVDWQRSQVPLVPSAALAQIGSPHAKLLCVFLKASSHSIE